MTLLDEKHYGGSRDAMCHKMRTAVENNAANMANGRIAIENVQCKDCIKSLINYLTEKL